MLSCIDLIFTDQPSLVVDSSVHPTLHENCDHQITYCKFNLKIEYPERLVWDFQKADVNAITTGINQVDWKFMFFLIKMFTVFSNFIPNKLDTFDDKDPPWMTEKLSDKTQWKHKVYREYLKNGKTEADYTLTKKLSNV